MAENPVENYPKYDVTVNDPERRVPASPAVWRPSGFQIAVQDLPLSEQAAKQLEEDIRGLIEAELKADPGAPNTDDSITVSLQGLGLRPDQKVRLSQAIQALVRERLATEPRPDGEQTLGNGG